MRGCDENVLYSADTPNGRVWTPPLTKRMAARDPVTDPARRSRRRLLTSLGRSDPGQSGQPRSGQCSGFARIRHSGPPVSGEQRHGAEVPLLRFEDVTMSAINSGHLFALEPAAPPLRAVLGQWLLQHGFSTGPTG